MRARQSSNPTYAPVLATGAYVRLGHRGGAMQDRGFELPRIPLLRPSEKGSEQRSEGAFGHYEGAQIGQKSHSRRSVGQRYRRL
jgi:hypothetical protein